MLQLDQQLSQLTGQNNWVEWTCMYTKQALRAHTNNKHTL